MWISINSLNLIFITQWLNRICKSQSIIAILIATMTCVLVACNNDSSQSAQAPSSATEGGTLETLSINGLTLLDTRCSICHSSDRIKQVKKTREEWEETVNRMIGKGAKLTNDERDGLLDYLAKIYGDDATHKAKNTKN